MCCCDGVMYTTIGLSHNNRKYALVGRHVPCSDADAAMHYRRRPTPSSETRVPREVVGKMPRYVANLVRRRLARLRSLRHRRRTATPAISPSSSATPSAQVRHARTHGLSSRRADVLPRDVEEDPHRRRVDVKGGPEMYGVGAVCALVPRLHPANLPRQRDNHAVSRRCMRE